MVWNFRDSGVRGRLRHGRRAVMHRHGHGDSKKGDTDTVGGKMDPGLKLWGVCGAGILIIVYFPTKCSKEASG